jgi:serine/threonine protein phosphatase PrpC
MSSGYTRLVHAQNGIEAVAIQQPQESSDHDRVLFDTANNWYGVFDGAGTALASNFVLETVRKYSEQLTTEPLETQTPAEIIRHAQNNLMEWLSQQIESYRKSLPPNPRDLVLTTASIIRLRKTARGLLCLYASAGDSPIYHFNQERGLVALAEDEGDKTPPIYDEIVNFLGSPEHQLSKYGEAPLESGDCVIVMSDGVVSKRAEGGVDDKLLEEILHLNSSPVRIAETLLSSSDIQDDKTVIIIRNS